MGRVLVETPPRVATGWEWVETEEAITEEEGAGMEWVAAVAVEVVVRNVLCGRIILSQCKIIIGWFR
jgi:hypothetical protein